MVVFDNVALDTALTAVGLTNAEFEDKLYQVLTVPTSTTFTIESVNQANAVVATNTFGTTQPYVSIGPSEQTYGYGFGGIAVALMGRNHPVGILIAAFLFGILYQ